MNTKIHYTKPSITDLEVAYASDAARNGWGPRCYDYIHKFEAGFRAFAGTRFAIATSSCTGACIWAYPRSALAAATRSSWPTSTGSRRLLPLCMWEQLPCL